MSTIGKGNFFWPDWGFFQPGSGVVREPVQALSLGTMPGLGDTGALPSEGLCWDHLAMDVTSASPAAHNVLSNVSEYSLPCSAPGDGPTR